MVLPTLAALGVEISPVADILCRWESDLEVVVDVDANVDVSANEGVGASSGVVALSTMSNAMSKAHAALNLPGLHLDEPRRRMGMGEFSTVRSVSEQL
jgi:hypothetical protein